VEINVTGNERGRAGRGDGGCGVGRGGVMRVLLERGIFVVLLC